MKIVSEASIDERNDGWIFEHYFQDCIASQSRAIRSQSRRIVRFVTLIFLIMRVSLIWQIFHSIYGRKKCNPTFYDLSLLHYLFSNANKRQFDASEAGGLTAQWDLRILLLHSRSVFSPTQNWSPSLYRKRTGSLSFTFSFLYKTFPLKVSGCLLYVPVQASAFVNFKVAQHWEGGVLGSEIWVQIILMFFMFGSWNWI